VVARLLVELDQWDPTTFQLTVETLDVLIDHGRQGAREARRGTLRVLDGGRA
jgi:hypothetical protein